MLRVRIFFQLLYTSAYLSVHITIMCIFVLVIIFFMLLSSDDLLCIIRGTERKRKKNIYIWYIPYIALSEVIHYFQYCTTESCKSLLLFPILKFMKLKRRKVLSNLFKNQAETEEVERRGQRETEGEQETDITHLLETGPAPRIKLRYASTAIPP